MRSGRISTILVTIRSLRTSPEALRLEPLHPIFAAQASGVDLRELDDAAVGDIDAAMDRYAVLVFRDQPLTEGEQIALARRFGPLDAGLRKATGAATRFQYEELIDIGNVRLDGEVAESGDQKLIGVLANQLWHSDRSFQDIRSDESRVESE